MNRNVQSKYSIFEKHPTWKPSRSQSKQRGDETKDELINREGKEKEEVRKKTSRGGFFSEAGSIPRIIKAGLTGGRWSAGIRWSADQQQRWTHSSNSWQRRVIIINHECQEAARWLSVGSRCREFSVSKVCQGFSKPRPFLVLADFGRPPIRRPPINLPN